MSNLFQQLNDFMLADESLRFSINKEKDGQLTVVLEPILGQAPENMNEAAEQARANLAFPIKFSLTPEQMDAEFANKLSAVKAKRQDLKDAFDDLMSHLKDATQATRNASEEANKNKNKGKGKGKQKDKQTNQSDNSGDQATTDKDEASTDEAKDTANEEQTSGTPASVL